MYENYETQAETEERLAVESGAMEYFDTEDPMNDPDTVLTVCCPNPEVARLTLCGCGGYPYL